MSQRALITGSCGLIGSEVSLHMAAHGFQIFGVDNNERAVFFGPEGDTRRSLERLDPHSGLHAPGFRYSGPGPRVGDDEGGPAGCDCAHRGPTFARPCGGDSV